MRNGTLQSQNCSNFARECQKITQALLFLIRTELSFFYHLEFILFWLFLILFFVAETGVVFNLLSNFDKNEPRVLTKFFLYKKSVINFVITNILAYQNTS